MAQHTQPVNQSQQPQQQQQQALIQQQSSQQQQTSNNNNSNSSTQTPIPQQQQQQQQQQQSQNNNVTANYSGGAPPAVYNQPMHSANLYMPSTHGVHQPMGGTVYPAIIPGVPGNVYVNNVTANVNLHGWTAHPVPAYMPGGPQYIPGDVSQEQITQGMQMQTVAIANTSGSSGSSSSGRGSRRARGRSGNNGSRRNDYVQRQQQESPVPQDMISQQQQQIESQGMAGQYPQYAYQYTAFPAYFGTAPQNHMIHPQSQQATGPLYVASPMSLYHSPQMYNYPSVMYPSMMHPGDTYQLIDDQGDDRQNPDGMIPQMWHQPMYQEEYVGHELITGHDDMNHNAPSLASSETPSMLSPNYHIYDPQMQQTIEMQQQMGVMHIYDDQQLQGHPAHMHGQVGQLEEDITECGAIQMVPAMISSMQIQPDSQMVHHHQQHQQHPQHHLMQGPIIAIESAATTHQQLQPLLEHTGSEHGINDDLTNDVGLGPCDVILCESSQQVVSVEHIVHNYQQTSTVASTSFQHQAHLQQPLLQPQGGISNDANDIDDRDLNQNVPNTNLIIRNASPSLTSLDHVHSQTESTNHSLPSAPSSSSSHHHHPHHHHNHHHHHQQQQQQQATHQQLRNEENYRKAHHNRSSSSNSSTTVHQQHNHSNQNVSSSANAESDCSNDGAQHQTQQQTPVVSVNKTMSWTNSQNIQKKSTASVAVTATPASNNKQSNVYNHHNKQQYNNNSNTNNNSYHQHHYNQHHQQHHSQQVPSQPQVKNYGVTKTPSSPISTNSVNPMSTVSSGANSTSSTSSLSLLSSVAASSNTSTNIPERKQNQTEQQTKPILATSTASTTVVPQQFQQQQQQQQPQQQLPTSDTNLAPKQQATAVKRVETLNLAPPVTQNAASSSPASTTSWASLFVSKNSTTNFTTSVASTSQTNSSLPSPALPPPFSSKKPVAKVAPYEGLTPTTPTAPVVTPGTMSYSAASAQGIPPPIVAPCSSGNISVASKPKNIPSESAAHRGGNDNIDEWSFKFADFLAKYKTDLTPISLRPRGLTNRSNYCYVNSILQSLINCAPFFNLIKAIPRQTAALSDVKTPTINAMLQFASEFSTLPSGQRLNRLKGGGAGPKGKDEMGSDLQCDPAFEPTQIYKLWNESREEHVEGRQEDAEEFLGYVLNKLNDEMLEVIKLISKPTIEQNGSEQMSENDDGDVWQMICNNRNKGSVTRQTDFGRTPLSDIFRGELRSRLQREGEHSTDEIQPFFTLQLNIEKAASVKEALEILVGRDQLEGVTGSKSKQEVVAWQQMTLEKLPVVLILHLKWFDFKSDGCTKILKTVEFPVELKIDAKILASKKYSQKQRVYRLFAVVYHDGKEASKGHYITDAYHTGYSNWLRYDDSSVKPVSEFNVLRPKIPRVPYLLYYRRCDTVPNIAPMTSSVTAATATTAASSSTLAQQSK